MQLGNLKYREMFFNPRLHTPRGVPMATVIDGLIDGCRAAEQDLGVRCRLIADVYRQDSPAMALQMTEEVIANRRDELIGLGMDAAEAPDPPERFFESFRTAGEAGLHLTSHASEDGPPKNISTCLDLLGCERIDHGYHILEDDAVVERCREDGHPLHVLSHLDRGRLRLARSHDAPDQRDDAGGPARAPQLRRPDDVPHRHRQGVRRLRRARTSTRPRSRSSSCATVSTRRWLDAAEKAALHRVFDDEIAALDKELAR